MRCTERFHGHLHLTGSHMTSHDIYTGGGRQTFLAGSKVLTFTVPVLTTYTMSSMVTEDSAILVARMILRTPTGELCVEMDQVSLQTSVEREVSFSVVITYTRNTRCWSPEDSME